MEDVHLVEEASREDILGEDKCGRSCLVQGALDDIRVNIISQGAFTMPTFATFGMEVCITCGGGCRDDLLRAKSFRSGPRTSAESKTNATTVRPNVHNPSPTSNRPFPRYYNKQLSSVFHYQLWSSRPHNTLHLKKQSLPLLDLADPPLSAISTRPLRNTSH